MKDYEVAEKMQAILQCLSAHTCMYTHGYDIDCPECVEGLKTAFTQLQRHSERFRYHNLEKHKDDLPEHSIDVLVYFIIPEHASRVLNFVGVYFQGEWYKDGQKVDKETEVIGWRNIQSIFDF